jgi:hypothetical protein
MAECSSGALQELGRKEYLRQQIMTGVALLDRDPLILGEALIEVLQLLEEEGSSHKEDNLRITKDLIELL